jgi:hypothetical protein
MSFFIYIFAPTRNRNMLIVNYQRLNMAALNNPQDPMYAYAEEYDKGIRNLRKMYPEGYITLKQAGFPKMTKGMNAKGVELDNLPEPVPPIQISLLANFDDPKKGREHWAVCLGTPKPMEGGLWDIGSKRKLQMEASLTLDLVRDADLAFFLYYKSRQVLGGHLFVDDPKASAKQKGDRKRQDLAIVTAIWQTLADDNQLLKVAQGYGIAHVDKKQPDEIRLELENILKANDEKKKRDPSVRGTKEFMEDLKITDYMRLSAFIRDRLDKSLINWKPDGKYRVGDKVIAHVPLSDINENFKWLCNYYAAQNNQDKLKELFLDLINKEYLDGLTDAKDFRWIAKIMEIEGYYNKPEEQVKTMVYTAFNLV